jgi:hypothetical protein
MPAKTLFMETTEVSAVRTAGEISTALVAAGAREIAMQYGETNNLIGLRFVLQVENVPITFSLPVRIEPVFQHINGRRRYPDSSAKQDREQAERVAWRQLLRWIQAQLAMIDTGMVQPHEVFLPYMLQPGSTQTLFEHFEREGLKQLTAGA